MIGPRYTSLIAELPATVPFVGPETQERERGAQFLARIGANENVFGPSPRAVQAMVEAARDIWKYGDPENYDLKQALAKYHDVPAENIVVGEGIDGLLGYLVRLLVSKGTPVVTSLGAYPTFNYHVTGFGGELCTVPYVDDAEDPEALIELASQKAAPLIYLANPDNPMGTWHGADTVQAMIDAVPEGSLLCLDEAYIEFAPVDTAPSLDVNNTRVIRFRTFSKAYGMAGMRIGYGIGDKSLIRAFDKIRNHFGVSRIAQAAALAALEDQSYLEEIQTKVKKARETIRSIATENGLDSLPSATNFVAVDCGGDSAYAKAVLQGLIERGVFVRMPLVAPQSRCIRISAGTDEDLDLLKETLPLVLDTVKLE
ncbi:MAG: pyridoxal phosphate-dependent aminotransferase [Arenicellales bacterium]|nr:pyridoxal phosphate-dependent aminotransferase [Arenicellales bacterium]